MSEEEAVEAEVVDEEEFLEEAKSRLPITKDDVVDTHPLAKGLRSAKACVNEILKDVDNLEKLKMALQTEFDQDPLGFLKEFLPLLEKYDKIKGEHKENRQSVRLYQKDDETAIEIVSRED